MCWYRRVELVDWRRRRRQVVVYARVLGATAASRSTVLRPPVTRRRLLRARPRQRSLPLRATGDRGDHPRGGPRGAAGPPQDRRRAGAEPGAGRRLGLQPVGVPHLRRPPPPDRGPLTAGVLLTGDGRGGRPLPAAPAVVPARRARKSAQRPGQLREGLRQRPVLATDDTLVPLLARDLVKIDLMISVSQLRSSVGPIAVSSGRSLEYSERCTTSIYYLEVWTVSIRQCKLLTVA